jgi:hypothetical protein
MEDKELFESTETDAPVVAETPEVEVQHDGPARDEQGRFAPKAQDEPEPQPQAEVAPQAQQQARDEAHVPSWRLREVREEAERRLADERANWQRQFEALQRQNQPRPEPAPVPDVFENPNAFLEHGVRQQVDPIKAEVQQTRDYYSHREAVRDHGKEKVATAFGALDQAARSGNREAQDLCARVHAGLIDPWGEILSWHDKASVYQKIGNDPEQWFSKTLEERLADPKFAGELMQKIQASARGGAAPQGQGQPQPQGSIVRLPPSLSRVASAQVAADDDDEDMSNDGLWRTANA